ncbi:ComEA family DNA-binding protein [Salinisphaera sp.]|uniref:ComEA family DNA-binding protein n=1 Tax=Salinisphaera sp. TaxID=1914330 RepID=UPI002D79FDC3|nr:ComEA family DNA-binding protein [Salinisphaera sp.]HET7313589.1 ComEA family DNA-binding protein [Salinisphaera sp.]
MKKFFLAVLVGSLFYATAALAAVNVNTASADQLQTLDGIGSVKAQAIVADREANGNYESLDQLTRVDGIGDKTVAGLRSEATVGDDTQNGDSAS